MTDVLPHLVGYPFKTAQQLLNPEQYHTHFVKNANGKTVSAKYVSNPICTDVTLVEQTDLKYLFKQNPDLSGLALVMDDVARDDALSRVGFEDFMPAKDHYDIFDVAEFIDNAKAKFRHLPFELRLKYGNNPIELIKALDSSATQSAVIADLEHYFGPLKAYDDGATPSVDRDNQSTRPVLSAAGSVDAGASAPVSSSDTSSNSQNTKLNKT